jgi:hypothetical protein
MVKVREIVTDLKSETSDEEILDKYALTWRQLAKIYAKLFYSGYLGESDILRRREMRVGMSTAHMPVTQVDSACTGYTCSVCGFTSAFHFSECPRCHGVNLRRLVRKRSSVDHAARTSVASNPFM